MINQPTATKMAGKRHAGSTAMKSASRRYVGYAVLFLVMTIGSVWALALFYAIDYDFAVSVLGELVLVNPAVIIILHTPMIAGLLIYFLYDGARGLANFFRTMVPRGKDLIWIPILMVIMFVYMLAVRWLCMLFGFPVPESPQDPLQMLGTFLRLFVMEIGMVAIAIGWFGFFMPYMHRVTKSHIWSGIATGAGIGIFVAPGNLFSSFELATGLSLYIAQLCVLGIGSSMLLSRMKGNILFFLIPFWVSASGSHMQLYYFNNLTQIIQFSLFAALVVVLYFVLRHQGGGRLVPIHTFPEFVERDYTVRSGAVFPGADNRSKKDVRGSEGEPQLQNETASA